MHVHRHAIPGLRTRGRYLASGMRIEEADGRPTCGEAEDELGDAAGRSAVQLTDLTTASKLAPVRAAFNAKKGEARFLTGRRSGGTCSGPPAGSPSHRRTARAPRARTASSGSESPSTAARACRLLEGMATAVPPFARMENPRVSIPTVATDLRGYRNHRDHRNHPDPSHRTRGDHPRHSCRTVLVSVEGKLASLVACGDP